MDNLNKVKRTMIVLSILFLLIGISLMIFNVFSNITFEKSFKPDKDVYPYVQAVINGDIDLNEISAMFPHAEVAIDYNFIEEITSPVSISYYKNIDDKTPVYVIDKGDIIHFKMTGKTSYGLTYQGVETLPTNMRGWRLGKPFDAKGKETNDKLLYVKLSDLQAVSKTWLDENPKVMTAIPSQIQGLFPTKQEYVNLLTLYIDRVLYEENVYLSSDLYKPILSLSTCIAFVISFVILALYFIVKVIYERTKLFNPLK